MKSKSAKKLSSHTAKATAKQTRSDRRSPSSSTKNVAEAKEVSQPTEVNARRVSVTVFPDGRRIYGSALEPKHFTSAEIEAAVAAAAAATAAALK